MWTRSMGTDALPSLRRNFSPWRESDLSPPPQLENVAAKPFPARTTVSSGALGAGAACVGTPAVEAAGGGAAAGFSAVCAGADAPGGVAGFAPGFGGFGPKKDDHRNITAIDRTNARRKRRESVPKAYLFRVTTGTRSIPPGWNGWQRARRF